MPAESITVMTQAVTLLAFLAFLTFIGAAVACVGGFVWLLLFNNRPWKLGDNLWERRWLLASFIAAAVGSAALFVLPAYKGSRCSMTLSGVTSPSEVRQEMIQGPDGKITEYRVWSGPIAGSSIDSSGHCENTARTFIEVNGPGLIVVFSIPVVFTLLPWMFYGLRIRPLIEALLAMILAVLCVVGMSMWGAAFSPSAFFMLLAALAALRTKEGTRK